MVSPRAAFVLLLVVLSGCAIGELHPTPNVLLKTSPHTIGVTFGPAVPEEGEPGGSYTWTAHFTRWHETLANGFHASFDRYFAAPVASPDLTLVILQAEPRFTPVVRAYRGTIVYQAELTDRSGKVIDTFAGTAVATQDWMVGVPAGDVLNDAVGNLYERIAQQLPRDL